MNLWSPFTPVAELPNLSDKLKRRLRGDALRTVERLDQCPAEQLRVLGYSDEAVQRIRASLRLHRQFCADLADILLAEGFTQKMLYEMQPFDLLRLPLTTAQVGYLLRWQMDVAGRYGEQELFCVTGGRVYYCTGCPYRDERARFCGWCTRKLLDDIKEGNPTLVADAVLSVFKEVFSENWGIRSQDVMSAALLTLAQCEGASLLWLPALLTDAAFRRKVTAQISDRIGLEPFWTAFESMKDTERRMEIAPVLNKIRQFLLRPGLRNVLGQAEPKFRLEDLFNKRRIVLVPLNKGVLGSESARLLGSLIVGMTWTLALSRASLPPEQRHLVSVYIDELQDYLSLPTDLSDALAQARGLGVGLTMAHQYREQLPPDIRAGVDANARNKVAFGLNAGDAKSMAAMAPELTPEDFMLLPRYQIYTSFMSGGQSTGWIQGKTLPAPVATRLPAELRAKSMAAYGKSTEEIEAEYLAQLGYNTTTTDAEQVPGHGIEAQSTVIYAPVDTPVGRRKKVQPPDQSTDQPPD